MYYNGVDKRKTKRESGWNPSGKISFTFSDYSLNKEVKKKK